MKLNPNWANYSRIFFFVIAAFELISHIGYQPLSFINNYTKPMLIPALALFFFTHTRPHFFNKFIYLALFFAWLGDVFLMFTNKSPLFFSLGLGSFLIMQLLYIYLFKGLKYSVLLNKPLLPMLVIIIGGLVLYFIWAGVSGMQLPVALYFLAILTMVLSALSLYLSKDNISTKSIAVGATLFMISDSILALNKFAIAIPMASLIIMATYIFAQYYIITGLSKR